MVARGARLIDSWPPVGSLISQSRVCSLHNPNIPSSGMEIQQRMRYQKSIATRDDVVAMVETCEEKLQTYVPVNTRCHGDVGSHVFCKDLSRSVMRVVSTTTPFVFVALSAVACTPKYPLTTVLPGPNTKFTTFKVQDEACRQWAAERTHSNAAKVTMGTVAGTPLGAAVGVGVGALTANPHMLLNGAIGGGAGAIGGGALANRNTISVHDQYDRAYTQCMYAQGNQVPLTLENIHPRDHRPTIIYGSGARRYSRPIIYSMPSSFSQ
jgi:hypothetical protein